MPFGLYFEMNERWDLGGILCDFWISCDILCSTASIVSIAFHSMDKYYSLWTPDRYYGHVRHQWGCLFVAITWGLASFVALSAGASGWAREDIWAEERERNKDKRKLLKDDIIDFDHFDVHMMLHEQLQMLQLQMNDVCTITNNPMFAVYSAAVSFYLPATAIVFYSIAIRKLAFLTLEQRQRMKILAREKRRNKKNHIRRRIRNPYLGTLKAAAKSNQISRSRRSQLLGRERQVAFLWQLTICTFLVCWAPFFIAHPLSCFGVPIPELALIILPWLGYSHSIVNPILHAFLEPNYVRTFVKPIIGCFTTIHHFRNHHERNRPPLVGPRLPIVELHHKN